MTTTTLLETCRVEEDSYTSIVYDVMSDSDTVGHMTLMVDGDSTYIERLDIEPEYQNNGFGTAAIKTVARTYDVVFAAPDNDGSQRLLERIGCEYTGEEADYIDQGYGVYRV